MKISLFTPTHDTKYLPELWDSIKDQDFDEWVILYNNGAQPVEFSDKRVVQLYAQDAPGWVGALKALAVENCTGDILLEMDHDDTLTPDAIKEVRKAFMENPNAGFVYSNTIHSNADHYSELYGWRYKKYDEENEEHISFEPTPESVSKIWFAPNHLRAFRREAYETAGGYNKGMRVLDDLDLMCRLYCVTDFYHINKPLYKYRLHGENTYLKHNAEIQNNVARIYDQYIESMTEKWSRTKGLALIELGGRMAAKEGFITVDLKGADINTDLNNSWPFEDNSVGVIRAFDIFEHLKDPIWTMQEASRVLAPGGWIHCQVPSTDGRGAFQDPTHKSFWNENSFLYYTRQSMARYIDTPVRFQAARIYTTEKTPDQVCWVRADLINLKDGYRPCGLIEI